MSIRSVALAILAALAAAPVAAQTAAPAEPPIGVAEALRGAWFAGACADPTAMLAVTARSVARLAVAGESRLIRFREARQVAGWTLGTGGGGDVPRLMLRPAPGEEALQTAEPDAKTRDDRLPGEAPVTSWRRCPAPPVGLLALHGEGIGFLASLEFIEEACGGASPGGAADAAQRCVATILAQADASGDGMLSRAEFARLARGAAWVLAVLEGSTQEQIAGSVAAGAVAGLLAGRVLVESLDYDGDGRVSAAELGRDRGAFAAALGTAGGRPLRLEGLMEGAGVLRGLAEGLFSGR